MLYRTGRVFGGRNLSVQPDLHVVMCDPYDSDKRTVENINMYKIAEFA